MNAPHTSTARKPFNSLKERKGKVNKYYKVTGCLKIYIERKRNLGYWRDLKVLRKNESLPRERESSKIATA